MMEGRDETKSRRMEQAQRVVGIVDERWKKAKYEGNFAILGDLNDYVDKDTSLTPLINHQGFMNVSERLPKAERWTHYWAGGKEYRQVDYIFLSKSLAELNRGKPEVMRMGLPYRAEKYSGERFDEVGENHPKASDHAPLFTDIELM